LSDGQSNLNPTILEYDRCHCKLLNMLDRLQRAYRHRVAGLLFRKRVATRPERPLISFTFDDFPRSALLAGGAILQRFETAGTYYASFGLLGKKSSTGEMFTADDLELLVDQGHELGCHTFGHCDSWETEPGEFENAIAENRAALQKIFPGAEFQSFAYPISLPRPETKARVARHFACSRGGGQTLNAGKTDLNQLSAFFLEKSRDDFGAIQELIDRNRQAHGWLIFATHDISETPTPFGCSPQFFERVVRAAADSGAQIVPVVEALQILGVPVREVAPRRTRQFAILSRRTQGAAENPLVSILIPAYNAQEWIADTIRSAVAQTWEPKEIIVVDDGSVDTTAAVARQFESQGVRVVTQANQGGAAARNKAFSLSRGDYIQWLDADDLLAPDKIARQMEAALRAGNKKVALSGPFGRFRYRWYHAEFVPTELWADLSPAEWLFRKMGQNLYMQTATWLVSRELAEAAGPWDTRMLSDDDGEYFCRVLLKSEGTRFVPEAKVYYRAFRYDGLAYIGKSPRKIEALWLSMRLHIDYLRSVEDTSRTRRACVTYLQRNLINFYPNRSDIVAEARQTADQLGGRLRPPFLSWKYSWMKALFGWRIAKNASLYLRKTRWAASKHWDRIVFLLQTRKHDLSLPALSSAAPSEAASPEQHRPLTEKIERSN